MRIGPSHFSPSLMAMFFLSLTAVSGCSAGVGEEGGSGSGPNGNDPNGNGDNGGINSGIENGGLGDNGFNNGQVDNTTGSSQGCDVNTPCPAGEACVAKATSGCADADASTAEGVCRAVLKECTSDVDCGGDTICCVGDCAIDGAAGSCIRPCGSDETCKDDNPAVGVFSPSTQCEWKGPAADDPFPVHNRIMSTPLVANTPHDSGAASEIIIVTGDEVQGAQFGDFRQDPDGVFGSFDANSQGGVIRILNGQTCEQLEVIDTGDFVRSPATPSIADLDNDGNVEIVTRSQFTSQSDNTQLIAFKWNGSKYEKYWKTTVSSSSPIGASSRHWDGPSIHDLTDDVFPEVISRNGAVFDGRTGAAIAQPNSEIAVYTDPVIGDVDADGTPDIVANKVFSWTGSGWSEKYPGPNIAAANAPLFYAYADFGTHNATTSDFQTLDGIAEVVTSGSLGFGAGGDTSGHVAVYALDGTEVLKVNLASLPSTTTTSEIGGPPTVGDFDNDGLPEIALASATAYTMVDPDCASGGAGCLANYVRWSRPAKDQASSQTGSSLFDFESDGKVEAVYADECFLRIYDGESGEVLFSQYRSSCTWQENAVIADPDRDTRTEIIVNSNLNCNVDCTGDPGPDGGAVDPIHPGARCEGPEDCISGNCDAGFCRCETQLDCGNDQDFGASRPSANFAGLVCTTPITGTPGSGNVCRMQHPNSNDIEQKKALNGLKVIRDVLDRWSDSRSIWNQHAYSITNINDDGSVPPMSSWEPNQSTYNNFRQNVQGAGGANLLPDITSILSRDNVCTTGGTSITLTGSVCNRGLRVVGADMPATFYLGPPEEGNILCVSYTEGPVQLGDQCLPVRCEVTESLPPNAEIHLKVNDDGAGNRTTEECDESNNVDLITVPECNIIR